MVDFYGHPIGQAIIFCRCVFFFILLLSFFFPQLFSAVADWMSTVLPHMICLSTNLECRSEMCCTRLAEIQDAKYRQNIRHLSTIPVAYHTNLSGDVLATKACIDNTEKKLVKQQYGELQSANG